MRIRIGENLGKYYDLATKYIPYKIKNGIWLPRGSEMFEGIYEEFPGFLPMPNDLVVDVGAWVGDYAVLCNRKYGANVVAFEPLTRNYNLMKDLIRRNRAKVDIHNVALSSSRYSKEMLSDNNMLAAVEYSSHSQVIDFIPLDEYGLKPNILKIDVEGFEMDVLKGSVNTLKTSRPKLIIETHSSKLEAEVRGFLGNFGYTVQHEKDRHSGIGWMDTVVVLFLSSDQSNLLNYRGLV